MKKASNTFLANNRKNQRRFMCLTQRCMNRRFVIKIFEKSIDLQVTLYFMLTTPNKTNW